MELASDDFPCEAPMLDKMTNQLSFHGHALTLRAERQRTLASNIANADTPGYVARDFKFADALRDATAPQDSPQHIITEARATGSNSTLSTSSTGHLAHASDAHSSLSTVEKLGYSVQTQPSLDNNSVDLDRERANFVDNAVRYEAALRFINGTAKTMLSAIQGQ